MLIGAGPPPPSSSKLLCVVCECNGRAEKGTTTVKTKVRHFPINFDFLGEGFPLIGFHAFVMVSIFTHTGPRESYVFATKGEVKSYIYHS